MCNEYARRRTLERIAEEFSACGLPSFSWRDGLTPNDLDGKASVRIGETAPIVRLQEGRLVGEMGLEGRARQARVQLRLGGA